MRLSCIAAVALLACLAVGCDGGGDGDGQTGIVLAQGSATAPAQGQFRQAGTEVARFSVSEAGVLQARANCTERCVPLRGVFVQVATGQAYGSAESPSPLVVRTVVSAGMVSAGHDWVLFVARSDGSPGAVSYSVTFVPE
jgi:hypothetical protein